MSSKPIIMDLLSKAFINQTGDKLELEARFGTLALNNQIETKVDLYKGLSKEEKTSFKDFIKQNRFMNKIKKNQFDNVVKILKKMGFTTQNPNETLKIITTHSDKGIQTISNIRTEIHGVRNIQDYCQTDSITYLDEKTGSLKLKEYVSFTNKRNVFEEDIKDIKGVDALYNGVDKRGNKRVQNKYDVHELNFRVSLQFDRYISKNSDLIKSFINNWENRKKTFRFIKRYIFVNKDYPEFEVHLSIVRSSKKVPGKNVPKPEYTVKESELFNQPEQYEIEIEAKKITKPVSVSTDSAAASSGSLDSLDSLDLSVDDNKKMIADFVKKFRKLIRIILCGIQNTQYPINYFDMYGVLNNYHKIISGEPLTRRINPKQFVGPSSISLEMKNIVPTEQTETIFESVIEDGVDGGKQIARDITIENTDNTILKYYTVTDKADGERRLLYVNNEGKIYMIDTNMNVYFTGLKTTMETHFNSLLDGEYIPNNKQGKFINRYAAFDIYIWNGEEQRHKPFTRTHDEEITPDVDVTQYRLPQLHQYINNMEVMAVVLSETEMNIEVKHFEYGSIKESADSTHSTIFQACNKLLSRVNNGEYEYETDGLIFTPAKLGVGFESKTDKIKNNKYTWTHSFKWKPPQYNTIDFLVTTQKNTSGRDMIHSIYQAGEMLDDVGTKNIQEYKTLILRVGYDVQKHGFHNPYNMVMEGDITTDLSRDKDDEDGYKPVPFYPSKYNDEKDPKMAHTCNIMLKTISGYDDKVMFADDGEPIEDETIVEFAYDKNAEPGWRWKPLRVRYDKTEERRAGHKNFGNAFHVAESVWNSIHNPIKQLMLRTGKEIPDNFAMNDAYYNRDNLDSKTRELRNFHNLYVKNKLILSIAKNKNVSKLMDVAVGKGGDFAKWIAARMKFVFGVDVSKDNIENRVDGACARYIRYKRSNPATPDCIFLQANSGLDIHSGEALKSEKSKEIVNALFTDKSQVSAKSLPPGVRKYIGILEDGADVVSCQFALHYFFKDIMTLHKFVKNVSDSCRVGGYFTGTCYDGLTVFNELKKVKTGEYINEFIDDKKIWEVRKMYNDDEFENNANSVGLAIDVYQETINKVFREYLVNFDFFIRIMDTYGFTVVDDKEAKYMGLPNGTGMFDELYNSMNSQIAFEEEKYGRSHLKLNVKSAVYLNEYPQQMKVSYLNRYFVFKKTRNVNTKLITQALAEKETDEILADVFADKPKTKTLKVKKTNAKGKTFKVKGKTVIKKTKK
jgi:hypothetical protein